MFQTEMQERYQNTVELQGFDGKHIKMLIDYMYGETIVIDDENVVQLLAAADYLLLQDVKDFCIEYLKTRLSSTNCLDALTAYSLYISELSRDHIYMFVSDNFDAVFEQEKFKNLATNDMTILVDKLKKNKVNQESMFLAIISWVEHCEGSRKEEFPSLFDLLDLSQLSTEFIENVVMGNPLVAQNPICMKSIVMSMISKQKKTTTKQTNSTESSTVILSLGGVGKSSVVEVFDISANSNITYPDLPKVVGRICAEKVDQFVYYISEIARNIYRLDLTDCDKRWTKMASMNKTKYYHASAVFKRNIVVSDRFSTEMFEIDTSKTWRNIQSTNTSRSGHALVVCNDCLFAIGGFGNDSSLASMEKLSNLNRKWEIAQPMNTPRNRLAAVCLDGVIYASGVVRTVEKFVPEQRKWSNICGINRARWDHAACVMGAKIYVVGGKDEKRMYVSTVECYDPTIDLWKIVGETVGEFEGHAVVVV